MYSTYGVRGETTSDRTSQGARVSNVCEAGRDLRTGLRPEVDGDIRGSAGRHVAVVEAAMLVLGRRWRPSILYLLLGGPQRYNALLRQLPGATPKMLTQQLKALEEAGLVDRFARRGGARHTEYALTIAGETLRPVLDALRHWASGPESASRVDGARAERVERETVTTVVARADTELRRVG